MQEIRTTNSKHPPNYLKIIKEFLMSGNFPKDLSKIAIGNAKKSATRFKLLDGELYYCKVSTKSKTKNKERLSSTMDADVTNRRVIFSVEEQTAITLEAHNGGENGPHRGMDSTMKYLSEKYYWSPMRCLVRDIIKNCVVCNVDCIRNQPSNSVSECDSGPVDSYSSSDDSMELDGDTVERDDYIAEGDDPGRKVFVGSDHLEGNSDKCDAKTDCQNPGPDDNFSSSKGNTTQGFSNPEIQRRKPKNSHVHLETIKEYLMSGKYPAGYKRVDKGNTRKSAARFRLLNGDLYYSKGIKSQSAKESTAYVHSCRKVIFSVEEQTAITIEAHASGENGTHLGMDRTLSAIMPNYYWNNMRCLVRDIVKNCVICSVNRTLATSLISASEYIPKSESFQNDLDGLSSNQDNSTLDMKGCDIAEGDDQAVADVPGCDNLEESSDDKCDKNIWEIQQRKKDANSISDYLILRQDDTDTFSRSKKIIAQGFWNRVEVQILPVTGNKDYEKDNKRELTDQPFVIIAQDKFSRWPEAMKLDTVSERTISQYIIKLIARFGVMRQLVILKNNVLKRKEIDVSSITANLSSFDMSIASEKFNPFDCDWNRLINSIESFVRENPESWTECLDLCLMPLRNSVSPQTDYSPAFITMGRDPVFPSNYLPKRASTNSEIMLELKQIDSSTSSLVRTYLNCSNSSAKSNTSSISPSMSKSKKMSRKRNCMRAGLRSSRKSTLLHLLSDSKKKVSASPAIGANVLPISSVNENEEKDSVEGNVSKSEDLEDKEDDSATECEDNDECNKTGSDRDQEEVENESPDREQAESLTYMVADLPVNKDAVRKDPVSKNEVRKREPVKRFQCGYCQKEVSGENNFKEHEYKHTKIKPFTCPVCSKKYSSIKGLRLHKKRHNPVSEFLCSICGRGFPRYHSLRDHIKKHSKVKPPKPECQICFKVCATKHHLLSHMKNKHPAQKPVFMCGTCGKQFTVNRSLKRHEEVHKGIRRYACSICDRRFFRKEYLTDHLNCHKNDHSTAPPQTSPSLFVVDMDIMPQHQLTEHKEMSSTTTSSAKMEPVVSPIQEKKYTQLMDVQHSQSWSESLPVVDMDTMPQHQLTEHEEMSSATTSSAKMKPMVCPVQDEKYTQLMDVQHSQSWSESLLNTGDWKQL